MYLFLYNIFTITVMDLSHVRIKIEVINLQVLYIKKCNNNYYNVVLLKSTCYNSIIFYVVLM
jgi:hypothetical protein